MLVMDGNVSHGELEKLVRRARKFGVPTLFEPTSEAKSKKIVCKGKILPVDYMTPNEAELYSILAEASGVRHDGRDDEMVAKAATSVREFSEEDGLGTIMCTRGVRGIYVATEDPVVCLQLGRQKSAIMETPDLSSAFVGKKVWSTTGCGDSFVGGFVHATVRGKSVQDSVLLGQLCARAAMFSESAVHQDLGSIMLSCPISLPLM